MGKILTKMDFDLLEYKYYEELRQCKNKESPSSLSLTNKETSVPLVSLMKFKKPTDIHQGYITERQAGKYIERTTRKIQKGGNCILRIPDIHLWEGEKPLKAYHRWKDIVIDEQTGEMILPSEPRLMKTSDSRFANPKGVFRSCQNFKWLIRANADKIRLFVTLTYADNMTDTKQLYQDYRKFWQRIRYEYPCLTGYLVAFEPQERGAWHAHMLLLSDKRNLFIPNKKMRRIWGKGFTKTQSCMNIHDVGSYLTAYLTNLKDGAKSKKGKRLSMYPAGFRFLRSSKDVERTKINRWYGDIDKVDFNPNEYNLIYDYFNSFRLKDGNYQVRKITCLEKKPPSVETSIDG